ncbi:MAG TPA: hypothetical protein VFY15_03730, partial [Acidimicrobiia bacterium]|nr:hypothetical protein [Acidimicrobiia bacterium]
MHRRTRGLTLLALVLAACGGSAGSAIMPLDPAEPVTVPTFTSTTAGEAVTTTTVIATTTLPPLPPATFESIAGINTVRDFTRSFGSRGMARWEREVPGVADIRIVSTI